MKKKIRDLTIAKLYEFCKYRESCVACPFDEHFCFRMAPYMLDKETLETEIEIPDELVGNSDQLEEENNVNFYNEKPFEYHGTHNEVDYWIVSYGYHPLAYVKLNQIESKTFFDEYECHGEITFKGKKEFAKGFEYVIGWDYAHFILNDYTIYLDKTEKDEENLKRWTFDEVEKEVFDFIDKYKMQEERG